MKDLESLNSDLLADIVSRLDGLSLSSIASTSSQLRPVALQDSLWENLCHSAWPSTSRYPTFPSFQRLFADSYPKLFYDETAAVVDGKQNPPTSPCDFVSFVDVFYKNQCVFSTAVRGIPEVVEATAPKNISAQLAKFISSERWKWFLSCPFKLNILHLTHDDNETEEDENLGENDRNNQLSAHLRKDPMEDLNLSWILLDNKTGKAVNLSTWKPISVQSVWPYKDYTVHFGSIISVEESVLPEKLARINVTTKFKLTGKEGYLQWREISLSIEDLKGVLVDGKTSLTILNKALYCSRTTNQVKIESGFNQYEKKKEEMIRRRELSELVTNGMYICIQIAILAFLYKVLIH